MFTNEYSRRRQFGIDPFTVASAVASVTGQAFNIFGKKGQEGLSVKEQWMLAHADIASLGKNLLLALGYTKKEVNKLPMGAKASIGMMYNRFLQGDPMAINSIQGILSGKKVDPSKIDLLRTISGYGAQQVSTTIPPSSVPTTISPYASQGITSTGIVPQTEAGLPQIAQAGFSSPLMILLIGGGVLAYLLMD